MAKTCINYNWTFTRKEKRSTVDLPHTWNNLDGQDGGNDYYRGLCRYEKILNIEAADDATVHLEFEAANSVANVFVNGHHAGTHIGGYSTFRFDISDYVRRNADNEIRVDVDNSHRDDVYPQMADFTFQGGLYRDVHLIVSPPVHIDLDDDGSQGVYVSQTSVTEDRAELEVAVLLRNAAPGPQDVEIEIALLDHEGKTVAAKSMTTTLSGTDRLTGMLAVDKPSLWQGIEAPYLYTVLVTIACNGNVLDERRIPTGLRFFELRADSGFFLNGRSTPLRGVSRHQCREDVGWALSRSHQKEDMSLIKEVGANTVRLAHYQHNQYFYDLCDQAGMVVWAEIPYISVTSSTDLTGANALSQMKELVKQNYNHPSIIFWGLQNEITIGGKENSLEEIVQKLQDQTKSLDPHRITVQAQVGHLPIEDSLNTISDANAYNQYFGWYYKEIEDLGRWIDRYRALNPDVPLGISEYGAEAILTYHTDDPKKSDYTEEYHALYHQKALHIFNERPFLWGTYLWNMFDFAADQRDEGGVKGKNNKGLVTHDHKTRKDAFYVCQAHWSRTPMLHIASKRYVKRATGTIDVTVYSNQPSVTLFVNGVEHATMQSGNCAFLFENIPMTGQLSVKAVSGMLSDEAVFEKVAEPEPSYIVPEGEGGIMGSVTNWFDAALFEEEAPPLEFTDGHFSVRDTIKDIMAVDAGMVVLEEHAKPLFEHPMFGFLKNVSFMAIRDLKPDAFPDVFLYRLNEDLRKIKKD